MPPLDFFVVPFQIALINKHSTHLLKTEELLDVHDNFVDFF